MMLRYSTKLVEEEFRIATAGRAIHPGMLHYRWIICPNFRQDYVGTLSVALAAGYLKQVEELKEDWQYSWLHQWLRSEAHMAFLHSLTDPDHFQVPNIDEIGQLSKKILNHLLPKIQTNYVPRQRQLDLEAALYRIGLSFYANRNGTYETAIKFKKRALQIFEMLDKGAIELSYEADYEGEEGFVRFWIACLWV